MSESVAWTCPCGTLSLAVRDVPAGGTHAVCYCADCRAFARLRGAEASLDAAGGTGLYMTAPERIAVAQGGEGLRCLRLGPRGPLRWYAECCGAPVGNTAPKRGIPFASLMAAGFEDGALGPPRVRAHRQSATARVPKPHGSLLALAAGIGRRVLASRLSGGWRRTPFFADDGTPVAEPSRPDAEARRAAYAPRP